MMPGVRVIGHSQTMTVYEDEIPARRRGVGTKVLALACGILAILGSFWGIVWFIRSYVEPPRVMMPAGARLASRDSVPVAPPVTPAAADPTVTGQIKPAVEAQTPTAAPPPPAAAPPAVLPAAPPPRPTPMAKDPDQSSGSVADRWGPMNQSGAAPAAPAPAAPPFPAAAAPAPPPPPAMAAPAAPAETAPAALATSEKEVEEVAEGSVPAFDGPAPLPRRRPVMTAQRRTDPPLPRPRPDGQVAPQSVFIAVPTTDDRYPTGQ